MIKSIFFMVALMTLAVCQRSYAQSAPSPAYKIDCSILPKAAAAAGGKLGGTYNDTRFLYTASECVCAPAEVMNAGYGEAGYWYYYAFDDNFKTWRMAMAETTDGSGSTKYLQCSRADKSTQTSARNDLASPAKATTSVPDGATEVDVSCCLVDPSKNTNGYKFATKCADGHVEYYAYIVGRWRHMVSGLAMGSPGGRGNSKEPVDRGAACNSAPSSPTASSAGRPVSPSPASVTATQKSSNTTSQDQSGGLSVNKGPVAAGDQSASECLSDGMADGGSTKAYSIFNNCDYNISVSWCSKDPTSSCRCTPQNINTRYLSCSDNLGPKGSQHDHTRVLGQPQFGAQARASRRDE